MLGGNKKRKKVTEVNSLIGQGTEIKGDLNFRGGLLVDGTVRGNITSLEGPGSVLSVSEQGMIEGEVRVANIILNGQVTGDVYAEEHIELAPKAKVNGNVYYNLIEMKMGAEVNGSLVHYSDKSSPAKKNRPAATPVAADKMAADKPDAEANVTAQVKP